MVAPILEAFSISHAAILDGATGAETADIYGVRDGTLEVDTDSFNNTGDNQILSVWNWFNLATLTITSGFIPFSVLSLITGAAVTSSGTGANEFDSITLWGQSSLNQSPLPVLLRCPAKLAPTQGSTVKSLDIVLYRVQFQPIKIDGPSYRNGLVLSYAGQALMSSVDEKGSALTDPAIGRLISRPAA